MILGGQLHFNTFVGRVDKNNIKDINGQLCYKNLRKGYDEFDL